MSTIATRQPEPKTVVTELKRIEPFLDFPAVGERRLVARQQLCRQQGGMGATCARQGSSSKVRGRPISTAVEIGPGG